MNSLTTSVPSTLAGATVRTAQGNEFSNTGRDTIKITVQNINIDRLTATPESDQMNIVEDNEEPQLVSNPGGNFGLYSNISTVLAAIFGHGRIQPPLAVGDPTCSNDSNLLHQDESSDRAPGHGFEPAATISEITAHDCFSSSSSSNIITERYIRSMLDCQCMAGYPLYEPRPDCQPSTEYWKQGVRIGDVGIVTEDGIFDFLFNVCPSQNPLINPSDLPVDFEALERPEIRVIEQHFGSQTHLFNKTVNRIKEPDVRYKCLGAEGAILELPDGATLLEARDKLSFKELASRHAEKWYKYAIVNRHRDTPNGSLYLVTSCIKCTHWGIAVFDRPSASQDYLQFIDDEVLTAPDRNLLPKYHWKGLGAFITKVTRDSYITDSRDGDGLNQCIFLRGYKIMLRKDVWDNAVDPHSTGTSSITTSPSLPDAGNRQTRPGESSNQNDYLRREDGGSEPGGGTSRRPAQNTFERGAKPMDVDTLFATSWGERVIIQANFNASPLHPSDLINAVLLSQKPDAKVALTHDDDWMNLLQNHEDLVKIASSYTSVIDGYGSASLELIADSTLHGGEKVAPSGPLRTARFDTAIHAASADSTLHGGEKVAPSGPFRTARFDTAIHAASADSILHGGEKVAPSGLFRTARFDTAIPAAAPDDILSWTNKDPRESQLFNSWGVQYRFQTVVNGKSVTTLWRNIRPHKEDRVAKFEWSHSGVLARITIGKNIVPVADLVRVDSSIQGARVFNGPDGSIYRWRPSTTNPDILLQDSNGDVIAFFRPTKRTRYQIGDVYGELHLLRNAGAGTVMFPPIMDTVIATAMLYRCMEPVNLADGVFVCPTRIEH